MQIQSIILYNTDGETRTLSFKLGAVNIITGKSRTGKTAIIDIVDYCLGQSSFKIFEGVNRDTVAWYAVVLQINGNPIFIAKPPPSGYRTEQSQAFIKIGNDISIPPLSELTLNSNDDAVVEHLSRLIGISPNLNIPEEGQSRKPLEANIKHTKHYLFQKQTTIASQEVLFYRQQEPYIPQTIKDTLPYFLGAVREDYLQLVDEVRRARLRLSRAQKALNEAELIVGEQSSKGKTLIVEAQEVGLIRRDFSSENTDEVLETLQQTQQWRVGEQLATNESRLTELQQELDELRRGFRQKHEQIKEGETFLNAEEGYSSEANQQLMRLEAVNLFHSQSSVSDVCPLCSSQMLQPVPAVSEIKNSLERLQNQVQNVTRRQPRLQEFIQKLRDDLEAIRRQIQEKEQHIEALIVEEEAIREMRDNTNRVSYVLGRISLYLEEITSLDEGSSLRKAVEEAKEQVEQNEKSLEASQTEEAVVSILNRIGLRMTEWAEALQLEHSGSPYRIDWRRLTVIADTPERPIPLDRMGSAENWLGCHLIAHLALHQHFIEQNRPVPHFLILDQPSQAYFPSSDVYQAMSGTQQEMEHADADIEAVRRMFNLLFKVCAQLHPDFQIIILEHANLPEGSFQNALVEPPWTGTGTGALIPTNWIPSHIENQ
jgi:hypothetical protein